MVPLELCLTSSIKKMVTLSQLDMLKPWMLEVIWETRPVFCGNYVMFLNWFNYKVKLDALWLCTFLFPIYFFFFTTQVITYINLSCIFSGLYEGPQQSVLVLEDLIGKETCLLKNRNSSCKVLPKLIILLFFSFLK